MTSPSRRSSNLRAVRGAFLLWVGLSVVGAGCHREVASGPSRSEGLTGRTLPLLASPALRLTVAGRLGTRVVPVVLDVARPLSMVSQECFDGGPPAPEGTVRAPEIAGGFRAWPVVSLPVLTVGGASVPLRTAGLSGEKPCSLTLGSDVLEPYALTVDPLRREVTFTASRPREAQPAAEVASDAAREVHRVELSREPVGDWPLLAVRVSQGEAELTGPFVLTTREPFSRIAVGPAEAQGLQPLETVAHLPPRTFAVDSVDVAEGVGARPLVVEAAGRWDSPSSLGRLGPDVWGRFTATLDAKGGVLVLRRPRVRAVDETDVGSVSSPRAGRAEGPDAAATSPRSTTTDGAGWMGASASSPPPAGTIGAAPVPSGTTASSPSQATTSPAATAGTAPKASGTASPSPESPARPTASAAPTAQAPGDTSPSTSSEPARPATPNPVARRQQCTDAHGVFSEEACYGLHVRKEPEGGISVVGAVFRDLPEGGRLHLEPVGPDGQRLESGCGIGLSFPATSRGLTTQHRLPWPSLAQALPACHAALVQARGFNLALFEEGSQPECPTACAFVTETSSRRTVCECQPTPLGEGVAAPSRKAPSREPPREERELEPEDPR
ncbi:hypothetical protein [Myxococcus llanfairpwllgwyngyllgogerychwyrndrobwllllantysiliogogogochensis]|uniref:hypothetical protein n=1 Tax=Myxococcus llanfairpwllgwyngyllgogerychwyrndrobwllllantysiliogogogochensis TaxID=2590453 RepID=UPI001FE335EF|nr:hypothetical protein [Myxococcus llanfairpwllgwyngyllgogerychwyrndrobwllllantysiliogogogochensis]